MERLFIVKIESFDGRDTYVHCGNDQQDFLYCVVSADDNGEAEIVDNGYRSFSEAAQAWPDAMNAKRKHAEHR